ncbi:MAG TPA: flagellar hook-length control protein FliK [Acidimicrobiia bacterium]
MVAPLRTQPDGSYRLTVDLHPAELGRVQLEVHVEHGVVNVHLQADHASTSALLREGLQDLRNRLQAAGVRAGGVVVDHGDSSAARGDGGLDREAGRDGGAERAGAADGATATVDPSAPTSTQSPDALVDVRL